MSETPRLLVQRNKSSLVLDEATPDEDVVNAALGLGEPTSQGGGTE